jgi:hypothetical protein
MVSSPSSESPCLGVRGLPPRIAELAPQSIYAAVVDQQAIRLPLIVQSLFETLLRDVPCALVTPGDPAAFLHKSRLMGADLDQHTRSGQCSVHRQKADPALPVFRAGPAGVIEMLDRAVPRDGSLVVLDCADPYLFLTDPVAAAKASDGLQQWAQRRRLVVLAVFAPASRPAREHLTLRALAEDYGGFAVVRDGGATVGVEFRHWFGTLGASPRCLYGLETSDGQLVAASPNPVPAPTPITESQTVVATEGSLDDPALLARIDRWSVVGSSLDAIDTARRVEAGTVVLDFRRTADFRGLCQSVAALRALGSPLLTVVVRERGMRLRLPQQVALTRLGVSTLVARDADDQALKMAVRALSGMAFLRRVADDVDGVIAQTVATFASQLLVPKVFGDTVDRMVAAAMGIELPHVLLHVACDPAKAQQLGTLAMQRKIRDAAMTVDPSGLWMMLFGCPQARAIQVAERAFGRHFAEVAPTITVAGTVEAIVEMLARLPRPPSTAQGAFDRMMELVTAQG